jgi:two-component system response regulator RegA
VNVVTQSANKPAALIVDDDEVFRTRLCRALTDRGWQSFGAPDGESAVRLAEEHSPDLVVVDLRLPGVGGLDIIQDLRSLDDTSCIIVLTGYGSIATAMIAAKLGVDHYLSKPADADQILSCYQRLTAEGVAEEGESASTTVPSLARVEWEHIQRVLADCQGNISQAAKLLGLHRRSLQRKLSKHPPHR